MNCNSITQLGLIASTGMLHCNFSMLGKLSRNSEVAILLTGILAYIPFTFSTKSKSKHVGVPVAGFLIHLIYDVYLIYFIEKLPPPKKFTFVVVVITLPVTGTVYKIESNHEHGDFRSRPAPCCYRKNH